jgi:hypothetical protein
MREKHDEQERAALELAVQGLRSSSTAVSGLPKKKLESMCQDVINAWLSGRSSILIDSANKINQSRNSHSIEFAFPETLLSGCLGRMSAMEPFIELALGQSVKQDFGFEWDTPMNMVPKECMVKLVSNILYHAFVAERNANETVPFPDNPNGSLEL